MKSILDILLDPNDMDPITLVNESGERVSFEQVAIVPYDKKLYCILKPLDCDGIAEDEAVIFVLEDLDDEPTLRVETDKTICLDVLDAYYSLTQKATDEDKK